MLIDWVTVSAQALNFLILVWLMKRFLYKPILNAIDAREKIIAAELADADAKKNEAKKERDDFLQKNDEFDKHRASLMSAAKEEVAAERQALLEQARHEAECLLARRKEAMSADADNLNQSISDRASKEIFAIVRKTLSDLATVSLEERVGEVFTRRLREMDDQSKKTMGQALKLNASSALVRSAFELSADQHAAIQNALNETFSAEISVQFETTPNLISGIELLANGQSLAWSIADYLSSLEKDVKELLVYKPKNNAASDTENSVKDITNSKAIQQ